MNEIQATPKNIVLVGFMGSGKTTVGRELHQRLGYPLIDMDQVIEERAGKSIPAIFAESGETSFREMETSLLREIIQNAGSERRIISTGGGIVGSAENRTLLKHLGYVVWLSAPIDVILERTGKNRNRPLLQTDDPAEKIRLLMDQRKPLYEEVAHLKLDTSGLDFSELATGILECARYYFTSRA